LNLLSLRAAARLLHLDHRTVERAITNGTCPAVRLGRRWKLEETTLRRWASGGAAMPEIVIRLPQVGDHGSPRPLARKTEDAHDQA
jgi:excisionase family DNA binding protein